MEKNIEVLTLNQKAKEKLKQVLVTTSNLLQALDSMKFPGEKEDETKTVTVADVEALKKEYNQQMTELREAIKLMEEARQSRIKSVEDVESSNLKQELLEKKEVLQKKKEKYDHILENMLEKLRVLQFHITAVTQNENDFVIDPVPF